MNYQKIRASYFIFALFTILVPLATGSFMSMPRFLLQAFPLFFIIAHGLQGKYGQVLAIVLALLQGFLMVFWTTQSLLVV